ncbi:glycosyltransferase family 2 protein [Elusimicrobiota bacterium]
MDKNKLVILPAFNEGRFISEILARLQENTDADILVVDDGSTDDTYFKIQEAKIDHIIHHEENEGYGKSLIDGFDFAVENGYKKAVTMDCDAQHEPELVEQFFTYLNDADIISGSRYLTESPEKTDKPAQRVRVNRIITSIINTITGYDLTDAFCGFKGYSVEALKGMDLDIPGYGMPLQLWIQSANAGITVKEKPVALIYHTRQNFPGTLASARERLNYYRNIIKNEQRKQQYCVNLCRPSRRCRTGYGGCYKTVNR